MSPISINMLNLECLDCHKTSWRLPKDKIRQLKQYALDHDMYVTDLIQAIDMA
jgi:hypothetical protein